VTAGDVNGWDTTDTEDAQTGWDDNGQDWQPSAELRYIRDTVVAALPRVRDPHA
jgi:hypothetical protein